jgi:hypothetical protein
MPYQISESPTKTCGDSTNILQILTPMGAQKVSVSPKRLAYQ